MDVERSRWEEMKSVIRAEAEAQCMDRVRVWGRRGLRQRCSAWRGHRHQSKRPEAIYQGAA